MDGKTNIHRVVSDLTENIDHAVEPQIGGKDNFDNLWPLPSGENRSSGYLIKSAKTKPPGEEEITIATAHEKKKKQNKPLWLMVTRTHQR